MSLQVRRSTYRGREGFTLCGQDRPGGWHLRMFFRARPAAVAARRCYWQRNAAPNNQSWFWWGRVADGLLLAERQS